VLKDIDGIEGVADIEPLVNPGGSGVVGGRRRIRDARALQLPRVAARGAQTHAGADHSGTAAAPRQVSGTRPSVTARNALGSGEGQGGYAISANMLGPGPVAAHRLLDEGARGGAERYPSITEPKLSLSVSNPEIHVAVDRRRAADLGVRMATVGNTLRLAVAGDDRISFYKEGQEQYPVKIRVLENQRRDAQEVGRLTVPSVNGPVRIDNIARIERGLGPSALQRSNRQFTVQLTADLAPGHALDEAASDVRKLFAGLNMPPDMSFRLQGQSKILDETTANMIMAIGLAMIFVYMVLASQFESFLQPIVIMLVLPIAVPFALFTLWATGRTLNLWSALGMLLLLGIVKKNSILQVDYANTLRAAGMPLREAIVEACRTRLRPILMTTFAIIAGLIPTALGIGIGGTGRAAIAVTVIGGQSLCLFLTLLLTPVAYEQFDAIEQAVMGAKGRAWLRRAKAAVFVWRRPADMANG
jgi:HAE1 family hydrophobic/amphiphilic exporter-1